MIPFAPPAGKCLRGYATPRLARATRNATQRNAPTAVPLGAHKALPEIATLHRWLVVHNDRREAALCCCHCVCLAPCPCSHAWTGENTCHNGHRRDPATERTLAQHCCYCCTTLRHSVQVAEVLSPYWHNDHAMIKACGMHLALQIP